MEGFFRAIGIIFVVIFLISVPLLVLYSAFRIAYGTEVKYSYRIDLVALSNSTEIHGHIGFLGFGSINSELVYTYMYQENGGYRMSSIPASKTLLYESSDYESVPHIDVFHEYHEINWLGEDRPIYNVAYYKVYIPEESIWMGYEVDVRR